MKSLLTLISVFVIFVTSAVLANADDHAIVEKIHSLQVPKVLLVANENPKEKAEPRSQKDLNPVQLPKTPFEFGNPDEKAEIISAELALNSCDSTTEFIWESTVELKGFSLKVSVLEY